jgi:hypothetical protein
MEEQLNSIKEVAEWAAERIPDPQHERIALPYWRGGLLTITSGYMAILMPWDAQPEGLKCWEPELSQRPPPSLTNLYNELCFERPMPAPACRNEPPEGVNARWEIERDCGVCGGRGELLCDLDHIHDCEDCDGEGRIWQLCASATQPVRTPNNRAYATRHIWYAKQLPRAEFFEPRADGVLAVRFQFGAAAIMCFQNEETPWNQN